MWRRPWSPVFAQAHKDVLDPRVDLVLVEAFFGHVAPVFRHRPLGRGRIEAEGFEAVMGRGPMKARSCASLKGAAPRAESAWDTELAMPGPESVRVPSRSKSTTRTARLHHDRPTPGGRLDSQGAKRAQRAQAPLYHPRLPARGASPRCRARDVLTATGLDQDGHSRQRWWGWAT